MYSTTNKQQQAACNAAPAAGGIAVQPKLSIGAVNDPLEHEADAMADKVMSMQEVTPAVAAGPAAIQRKCSHCEEEERVQRKPLTSFIQRKETTAAGMVAPNAVSDQIIKTKGSGNGLDDNTQSFMQSRFGTDFSNVKIHTGGEAIQMNRELNAKAFTVGSDIYFNEGQYDTNSDSGKRLLGHELTHVVQQGGVPNLIQRAVTDTKQESYAGLFELSHHTPVGGPAYSPIAQYDVRIEFQPYQVVDCDQIGMTQTVLSRTGGVLTPPSAAARARQLAPADGTEGVTTDRLSGRTSPLYGRDNIGTTATNAHFGKRTGNSLGDKAWMTDLPGWDGSAGATRGAGVTDSSHFELCAVCNAGKDAGTYYGCVTWGYDLNATDKFEEDGFTLVSKGTPSTDFLAAAKKWNDQTVPVATDDLPLPAHKTKQVSMTEAQLKAEIKTLETTLKGLAAGHADIPQITFEIKVYKDILAAIANNNGRGYSAVDIKAIQAIVGTATNGTFDFDTIMKIKRWQAEQGLTADGRFGPASKTKFDAIVAAAVTVNTAKGFTIEQVKKIQVKVGSNDDGTWGGITVKSVMVWQKDHGSKVTGQFDVVTQLSMFGLFGF